MRHSLPLFLALTAASLSACMLSPVDDKVVSSTSSNVQFTGYHFYPNQPVYIQAKNRSTGRFETIATVRSSGSVGYTLDGDPMYSWTKTMRLPSQYWSGWRGGRAQVRALWSTRNDDGGTVTPDDGAMISVDANWYQCYQNNPTFDDFRHNCASFHSPVADVYTSDYCASGPELNIASVRADTDWGSTDLDYVVRVGDPDDRISAVYVDGERISCRQSSSDPYKFSCDTDTRDVDGCDDRIVIEGFEVGSCGGEAFAVTRLTDSDLSCSPTSDGVPVDVGVMEMCKSEPTPAGWIMIDDMWDPTRCGEPTSISYNVKKIVRLSDYGTPATVEVCASEGIPTGWSGRTPTWNGTKCGQPTSSSTRNVRVIYR